MEQSLSIRSSSLSHVESREEIRNQSEIHLEPANDLGMEQPGLKPQEEPLSLSQLDDKAKTADAEAKKCGVDIAKRGFFTKLLTLVAASAVLVAAALVTGLTGGAGIPLLVLAGVGFAMAVGDVACAYKDWQSKKQGGEGLAMGGDSLGNLLHWLALKCVDNPDSPEGKEKAKKFATYGSLLTRGALAVGTVAVGGFLPVATTGALHYGVLGTTIGKAGLDVATGALTANATLRGADKQAHEKKSVEAKAKHEVAQPLLDQIGKQQAQMDQIQHEKTTLSEQKRLADQALTQLQREQNIDKQQIGILQFYVQQLEKKLAEASALLPQLGTGQHLSASF